MFKNKGFSAVAIIIILAVLAVGGYAVWNNQNLTPPPALPEGEGVESWKTYRNDEYGFEFKYPAEYVFREITELESGIQYIGFYDPKLEDASSLRFKISIDADPLTGADLLSVTKPENIIDGPKYIAIDSKQALRYKLRRLYEVYEDPSYPHDFIAIKRPGNIITFAGAGIKPDTRMFNQIVDTFKWQGTSLTVFGKVQYSSPKSCPGNCSKDGRLYVGDAVLENLREIGKDYIGGMWGNYGVVVGVTYCANSCLETFLILVGDLDSQPKQLDDVYIGLNPYIRDIKVSDQIVTVKYVPGGGNKPIPQDNPETKILSYKIVNDRLIPIN